MKLHELAPNPGATAERRRIGRGHGSGWGKTAGKGHKGQKARAGHGMRIGFEGGQMPLQRRLPKRGFHNIFAKVYDEVNLNDLQAWSEASIELPSAKVLGTGSLSKKLAVKAAAFTKSAKAAIEAAGGTAEVMA